MGKSVKVLALILVGAALPWTAAAMDCKYQNIHLKDFAGIDPPTGYDRCVEARAMGTITGRYVSCWRWSDIVTSDDIWSDGYPAEALPYDSELETADGTIQWREWTWFVCVPELNACNETGLTTVIGGTGDYEGAAGTLSFMPPFENKGNASMLTVEGYICTQ